MRESQLVLMAGQAELYLLRKNRSNNQYLEEIDVGLEAQ
jgi:hypothetical protein